MKMSTNFLSPSYSTETIDAFTLALTSESSSLFEGAPSWIGGPSTSNSLFTNTDTGLITTTSPSTNYFRKV